MQGTILVAVDGSGPSKSAASVAIQIAQREKSSIHGMYIADEALVLDPYSNFAAEAGWDGILDSRTELIQLFEARGRLVLDELRSECQQVDVDMDTEMLLGDVYLMLLKKSRDAYLLAMGRRGNGHASEPDHLGRYFLRIARHSQVPLLVGGDTYRDLNRLLVLYDPGAEADPLLAWAARFHLQLGMEILLGVPDQNNPKESPERVQKKLAGLDIHDFSQLTLGVDSRASLANVTKKNQVDMIMMHGYRHATFLQTIFGSQIHEILRWTQVPTLLV